MAVKMRLQRKGRKKNPFYHIVIADARAPRDGRFIEKLGIYNPMTKPATIDLDRDKAFDWLLKGAQPTETVRAILRFKGVMYRKHLMRGVKKGAVSQEDADRLYQEWVATKEEKVAARVEESKEERRKFLEKVSGKPARRVAPEAETTKDIPDVAAPEVKEHMTLAEEAEAKAKAEEAATAAEAEEVKEEPKAKEEPKEEPKPEAKEEPKEEPKAEAEETPAEETPAEEKATEEKAEEEEESKDDDKK